MEARALRSRPLIKALARTTNRGEVILSLEDWAELAMGIAADGFDPDSRGWKVNWSVHATRSLPGRLANPA